MDSKSWYKSKSVWLGVVALAYGLVKGFAGMDFNLEELAAIYAGLTTIFLRFGIN